MSNVIPLEQAMELYMESLAIRRYMEEDGLPVNSVVWTGEFRYVDEFGQVVVEDDMDVSIWYQYKDSADIVMWATMSGDGYYALDAEEWDAAEVEFDGKPRDKNKLESDPCLAGTPGCSIDHSKGSNDCEGY